MGSYIIRRLFYLVIQVFIVLTFMFALFRLVPGDPATLMIGSSASQEAIQKLREEMGLNLPIYQQYFSYMKDLLQGHLGESVTYNLPVIQVILQRIGPTLQLMLASIGIAVVLGIPAGVMSAVYPRSFASRSLLLTWVGFLAIPNFWLGLMLIYFFSVQLQWLPSIDQGGYLAIIMPALAISARLIALIARMTRSVMLEVLSQDYIRSAEAKGLHGAKIVFKHALKPALPPVLTMVGIQSGYLLGGSVVIENLFSYPGVGQLLLSAIDLRDYALMQGITLFFVGSFLMINLIVDLLYSQIDPRIRYD